MSLVHDQVKQVRRALRTERHLKPQKGGFIHFWTRKYDREAFELRKSIVSHISIGDTTLQLVALRLALLELDARKLSSNVQVACQRLENVFLSQPQRHPSRTLNPFQLDEKSVMIQATDLITSATSICSKTLSSASSELQAWRTSVHKVCVQGSAKSLEDSVRLIEWDKLGKVQDCLFELEWAIQKIALAPGFEASIMVESAASDSRIEVKMYTGDLDLQRSRQWWVEHLLGLWRDLDTILCGFQKQVVYLKQEHSRSRQFREALTKERTRAWRKKARRVL